MIAINVTNGVVMADRVAVADTRETRRTGLLGRRGLDGGEGLWIVPCRGVHTIGMHFPIDVLALDARGTVIDRVVHMKPWRIRLPRRGAAGVLELPAGTLDACGTEIGHRVSLTTAVTAFEPKVSR